MSPLIGTAETTNTSIHWLEPCVEHLQAAIHPSIRARNQKWDPPGDWKDSKVLVNMAEALLQVASNTLFSEDPWTVILAFYQ